jgi:hypothetical protein
MTVLRPHQREALHQAILTMATMASMLRDNDPHAVKLNAWANIIDGILTDDEEAQPAPADHPARRDDTGHDKVLEQR